MCKLSAFTSLKMCNQKPLDTQVPYREIRYSYALSTTLSYITMLSLSPCTYGMAMCLALGLAPGVVVAWLLLLSLGPELSCIVLLTWVFPCSFWLPFDTLFYTLFLAHLGYLHLTNASFRCCNSSSKSPGVVQKDFALWVSVPMTLYLAERL